MPSHVNELFGCANQTDANIANGARFAHAQNGTVYEHRLQSRTRTGIATGTQITMFPSDATEKKTLLDTASNRGGYPVIVGFACRISQTITVPQHVASTVGAVASIYERCALHDINLTPGDAGDMFLIGKTQSWSMLNKWFDRVKGFSGLMKAMRCATSERMVSLPRAGVSTNGAMTMAIDSNDLMNARTIIDDMDVRLTWEAQQATDTVTPTAGTAHQDCLYFPVTVSGRHGVVDAGMLFEEFFSADPKWQIDLTVNNNVDLYPTVLDGGVATSFGTYTIEWSVFYRVASKERKAISLGRMWRFNDQLNRVTEGNQSVIAAPSVNDHIFVGWGPRRYDANTDSGRFWWIGVDLNGGVSTYAAKMRIVGPIVNPTQNFNTDGSFLRVGDGVTDVLPANPADKLQRGDTILDEWNGTYYNSAVNDPTDVYHEGIELCTFRETGLRTSTTTVCIDAAIDTAVAADRVKYGATYIGGGSVAQAFNTVNLRSDQAKLGIGGLHLLPVAWSDRYRNGFMGVAARSPYDKRPITLNVEGLFSFPDVSPLNTTIMPLVAITLGPTYTDRNVKCGDQGKAFVNVDAEGPRSAIGDAMSVERYLPQVTKPTVL